MYHPLYHIHSMQSRLHLVIINLFENPLHWTIFLLHKFIPVHVQVWQDCSQGIDCFWPVFPWVRLRLVVFVFVLLSDVLGVEVFFLSPTVSGDDGGVCFCESPWMSPSSPRFDGIPWKYLTNFEKDNLLPPLFCGSCQLTLGEVTVESGGNFEDYIRNLSCQLFGPVNHGHN